MFVLLPFHQSEINNYYYFVSFSSILFYYSYVHVVLLWSIDVNIVFYCFYFFFFFFLFFFSAPFWWRPSLAKCSNFGMQGHPSVYDPPTLATDYAARLYQETSMLCVVPRMDVCSWYQFCLVT